MPGEQKLVGPQLCFDSCPFCETAICDLHGASLRDGSYQLLIEAGVLAEFSGNCAGSNLESLGMTAKSSSQRFGKRSLEFYCPVVCCIVEGQTIVSPEFRG